MSRPDDHVYYITVKLPERAKEFKYTYVRLGMKNEALNQEELSEVEKSRGKKFAKLATFFDFLEKDFLKQNKKSNIEYLIRFFI